MISLKGYHVDQMIHESARTRVFRGRREQDLLPVVIKVASTEQPVLRQIARMRHEYETLKSRNLPGSVRCYALETYRNGPALVLEDIGGNSLRNAWAGLAMPLAQFFDAAIALTAALGDIHEAGIIHKDINPSNLIANPATNTWQVIDFGLASRIPRETQALKSPNLLEGTLAYISPEQTGRMNRAIDFRSDLYSLGMTFYELLTGQQAFKAGDPMELVHCHIAKTPAPPHAISPAVPEVVSDIVMKLVSKTAEQRYQSAYGLLDDLRTCRDAFLRGVHIPSFVVGRRDISRKLQIPQKLYGRETETAELLAAFDRASSGGAELVLVDGYSGIGKSSLVYEVHKPIVQQRGYFVSGKFDQYRRDIPYHSVVEAFQQLFRQILIESEERLGVWRERLGAALGLNAQVLISVIPELEIILGKQPPVPELGPADAHGRFNGTFHRLVGVFAEIGHPLVLFLDDLQWADPASLNLIKALMTSRETGRVLLIGAYRDNEVSQAHPLMIALGEIRQARIVQVSSITLKALAGRHIHQLVTETVHRSAADTRTLAELLEQKTHGNPFFLNQLLTGLSQEGLLRFDAAQGRWDWDLTRIERADITDNVVDLMVAKIRRLSPRTQELLRHAACTGSRFELSVLAVTNERSSAETARDLWEALQEGLLLPIDDAYKAPQVYAGGEGSPHTDSAPIAYRFLHDRVQQSAYSMVPEEQRGALHLKIGRLLVRSLSKEALDAQLFDVVGHLNEGIALVTDAAERNEIAMLALAAGRKAKSSLAYATATRFLSLGMELLLAEAWSAQYQLAFDLHLERAQCEYLVGSFERADSLFETLLRHARTTTEKASVYSSRVRLYENTSQFNAGLQCGIECLRLFGIELAMEPSDEAVDRLLQQVKTHLAGREVHALIDAPEMNDPERLAASTLLLSMVGPAWFTGLNIFRAVVAHHALLSVQHGHTAYSAAGYAWFGVVLAEFGDHGTGYEFGQLAYDLNERYDNAEIRGKVAFLFGDWLNFRRNHIRTDQDYLLAGFQTCLQGGDLTFASYCGNHLVALWFVIGRELGETYVETAKWIEFARKVKQMEVVDIIVAINRAFMNLMGLTKHLGTYDGEDGFDEAEFERYLGRERSPTAQSFHYHHKSLVRYIFEDFDAALVAVTESDRILWAVHGHMHLEEHAYYQSLILTAVYPKASDPERRAYMLQIQKNQAKLAVLTSHAPMNYAHKHMLIEAEIARLEGRAHAAADLYDESIASALEHGYVNNAAIGSECAARFYLAGGKVTRARAYLTDAYQHYARWGATGKMRQLTEKHRSLLLTAPAIASNDSSSASISTTWASHGLDMLTVTKSSQAISSEIYLDKLLAQLTRILIENAGAERGFIILQKRDGLLIEAAGSSGSERVDVLRSIPVKGSDLLSEAVVQYVARTGAVVVLDNAASDSTYSTDPYIVARKTKSLLCLPAVNHGKLVGIVYLENDLSEGCFTVDRLKVLRILSTQIAISIENASLVANLEEKVRERTEELREKNAALSEVLNSLRTTQQQLVHQQKLASLGTLTAGIAHELKNPLNFINNFAETSLMQVDKLKELLSEEFQQKPLKNAERLTKISQSLRECVSKIYQHGQRANAVINGMLQHARTKPGAAEPVDLNSIVSEIVGLVHHGQLAKAPDFQVSWEVEYDAKVGYIQATRAEIARVFINILNNACYAVSAKKAQQPVNYKPQIVLKTTISGGRAQVLIRDNGIGISKESLARLFTPFFTTKPPGEGTGLGLSISHDIVVQGHRGEISVDSVEGEFTQFVVRLPRGSGAG